MSMKAMLEQIEHWMNKGRSRSRKKDKRWRNRWLRRYKKTDTPPTRYRSGWEY